MTIIMDDSHITSIAELAEFVKAAKQISLKGAKQKEVYEWVEKTLGRFRYFSIKKKEKTIVKNYLLAVTGLSDAQMTRLIAKKETIRSHCYFFKSETSLFKKV